MLRKVFLAVVCLASVMMFAVASPAHAAPGETDSLDGWSFGGWNSYGQATIENTGSGYDVDVNGYNFDGGCSSVQAHVRYYGGAERNTIAFACQMGTETTIASLPYSNGTGVAYSWYLRVCDYASPSYCQDFEGQRSVFSDHISASSSGSHLSSGAATLTHNVSYNSDTFTIDAEATNHQVSGCSQISVVVSYGSAGADGVTLYPCDGATVTDSITLPKKMLNMPAVSWSIRTCDYASPSNCVLVPGNYVP